ncbi:GIY-YIG nuclease family protein [Sphingomonas sp. LHG3406-1]|uniref:GIY-YIG nuclease family protein n=1 Tax=Sphingomonas sp. LHG3406-1 TaxID=2804617 RepID=UPI00262D6893|nr:GIY-YIG nuclease family protein [Sphingomonas sp. LHG3406-1]
MAKLTAKHVRFLQKHGFEQPEGWVLDCSGMTRAAYTVALKQEGKLFAYGMKPCPRGHTMRTAGGCPECNTSYIAYAKRSRLSGFVYIAKSGRLTKVGFSDDPSNRIYIANLEGYAGIHNWRIVAAIHLARAGQIEKTLHQLLRPYCVDLEWERGGNVTQSREVFRCKYAVAKEALLSLLQPGEETLLAEYS